MFLEKNLIDVLFVPCNNFRWDFWKINLLDRGVKWVSKLSVTVASDETCSIFNWIFLEGCLQIRKLTSSASYQGTLLFNKHSHQAKFQIKYSWCVSRRLNSLQLLVKLANIYYTFFSLFVASFMQFLRTEIVSRWKNFLLRDMNFLVSKKALICCCLSLT